MPDKPDYVQEVIVRYEGGFIGLEELAARLGSIVPWDMKGNIVLAENFESEETEWALSTLGAGSSATRQTRRKFSGDWSMKLVSSNVANAYSKIVRECYYPGAVKIALFGLFGVVDPLRELDIHLLIHNGTTTYEGALRYKGVAEELAFLNESNDWEVLDSSLDLEPVILHWVPFRLDIDISTGNYARVYAGYQEYDLSAYPLYSAGANIAPYVGIAIWNRAVSSLGSTFYVDDIVIAKNVP